MVVDDEENIQILLEEIFSEFDYSVISASSGEEALEKLKKESDIFVFFLDLQMPGIDGVQLCQRIRGNSPLCCIYALTAFSSLFDLATCREAGFDDYFCKPIEKELLIQAADQAFQKIERWKKKK